MFLFLDFDGVLHPDPCYDKSQYFSCLPRLESVLRDFPEVQIVISSTWREKRPVSLLKSFFSVDIGTRVIGSTPFWYDIPDIVEVIGYQRHAEIEGWLRQCGEPWSDWVAIDDKSHLFKPFLKNLIKTDPIIGFDEHAEKMLRLLLAKSGTRRVTVQRI
ncbi:HAD domain-containing protein [Undibacterium sp. Di27W]|uniref:HAD domain-containing protein n=1 Tax=Undibacterium sp. Di27W TaxID=3413036 RepID=UPI003BF14C18